MPADSRSRLAARETELVLALHGGATPPGLDEAMVALASAGIARKRARQVAKAFPALARDLGPSYQQTFAAYACANPPPEGGALADGVAFGAVAAHDRPLSDAARVERMINAAMIMRNGHLVPPRAPRLAAVIVRRPPGVVVLIRLPVAGTRVVSLRVPRLR
jgi:hypothetical protein